MASGAATVTLSAETVVMDDGRPVLLTSIDGAPLGVCDPLFEPDEEG